MARSASAFGLSYASTIATMRPAPAPAGSLYALVMSAGRAVEVGSVELRADERCAGEVRSAELRRAQVRPVELRARERAAAQIDVVEIGSFEVEIIE